MRSTAAPKPGTISRVRAGASVAVVLLAAAATAGAAHADAPTTTAGTTTESAASYAPLSVARVPTRCPSGGVAAVVEPGRAPLAVGSDPASGPGVYPGGAEAPIVQFAGADVTGSACGAVSVSIGSVSLFGGFVQADTVQSSAGSGSVVGLVVDGSAITLARGESVALGGWGLLVTDERVGATLSAPLAVRMIERRGPLLAGSELLIGFGSVVAPPQAKPKATSASKPQSAGKQPHRLGKAARKRRGRAKHLPLKVTPPLGLHRYVFPVAGGADYGDTYGGVRSDIRSGWHHGDDLFAPLGTPVLAVASGKVSVVGWQKLGGWRLWLRDAGGNRFYYAHLAAYSRWILEHRSVKAGQVIGFLGRTGDAFTTPPHLHFEIHPRGLLRLHYDGAVDPTSYLRSWVVERPKQLPQPARLRAPKGKPSTEATVVWRQLLATRRSRSVPRESAYTASPAPTPDRGPLRGPARPAAVRSAAAPGAAGLHTGGGRTLWLVALLAAVVSVGPVLGRRLVERRRAGRG